MFLAFELGAAEDGIDILRGQEIRSDEEATRIANAVACIAGFEPCDPKRTPAGHRRGC